ncbi:transcriptional regulator [Rhizobium paknamense]|uniref:Transcriptional regulator n=2 Tax=Rhizobium paknamense TaxID=1206817 RepID=A0ABU0III9_9HYPH|nr:transcriptional regulator [Rhizobium paknamense]
MAEEPALLAFIEQNPLGLLISSGSAGLMANPVPFFLRRGDQGLTLVAHLAKANPQWKALTDEAEILVVFSGTDHYVSPGWYATKQETGKVVPTWNYQLVQVRGTARIHQEPEWLLAQVSQLTGQYEDHRDQPWAVTDAPAPFVAAQLKGIVGVEIAVTAIEGKLKASQNRNAADQQGVLQGLRQEETAEAHAMAELMLRSGVGKAEG